LRIDTLLVDILVIMTMHVSLMEWVYCACITAGFEWLLCWAQWCSGRHGVKLCWERYSI